ALDSPATLIKRLSGQSVLELTVTPAPGDGADALIAALVAADGVDKAEPVAAAMPAFGPGNGFPGGFPGFGGGGPGAGAARRSSRSSGGTSSSPARSCGYCSSRSR